MIHHSRNYANFVHAEVTVGTGQFTGQVTKTASNENVDEYLVDGAVKVSDLSEKVRKIALMQFEKGIFGNVLGVIGGLCIFCGIVALPVAALIGYRIAGSNMRHAAVAFITFFVGIACIAIGLGDNPEAAREKKFFSDSLVDHVKNARASAGKDPLSLLNSRPDDFQYFHQSELLKLMLLVKNQKITGANTAKKRAECLLELDKLFTNEKLTQYLVKNSDKIATEWQKIVPAWQNLELLKQFKDADAKKQQLNREAETAKNITRAPGTGIGNLVDRDKDPAGAQVLSGVGATLNFLADQTVNKDIDASVKADVAKVDQDMYDAIASKWDDAMDLFNALKPLAA